MTAITCFDPDCRDDATVAARDEKAGCTVAFCGDHEDEWLAKDHITAK